MAEQYIGMSIAVIIVTASIALAGILIGVGRAFGFRRLENFGMEELVQSVINAAIIGGLASVIALVSGVSASLVSSQCGSGDAPAQLACALSGVQDSMFAMLQETMKAAVLVGYYQGLVLDFSAFSIAPFSSLSSVSNMLGGQLLIMQALLMLLELNVQLLNFVSQNALLLVLPAGLVLRTLFVTRKAGGFLIALAIGLYIFYPTFILVFPNPQPSLDNSSAMLQNFTGNALYASAPIVDLNNNNAIGAKLDLMSGRCSSGSPLTSNCFNSTANMTGYGTGADFSGDLTLISQSNSNSIAKVLLYSVVAPLLSLVVTLVFVKEAGSLLGSEIGLSAVASI